MVTAPDALANAMISQQSILKQGFQKTHFPTVLEVEFFLLSVWLISRRCAKLQIPISILACFFRHLNMAFFGLIYLISYSSAVASFSSYIFH